MYTENRREEIVLATTGEQFLDLSSTGDKGTWGPGFVPCIVRAAAIVLNATPGDAGVIKGDLRPTRGSDTNRTDGTVFTINLATSHTFTAGSVQKVIYHIPTTPVTVYPGQEVVVEVTDASASVTAARVVLYLEAIYSTPGNIVTESGTTTMVVTT